jgi:hypothetical protein
VVLALRDRLSRLDLRSRTASPQQLWSCPQGQHLTAIRAPPPGLAGSEGGPPTEHLLAAAASTGVPGSGSQLLIFDLRRPYKPVATWQQPGMDKALHEAPSLLRWVPTTVDSRSAAASAPGGGGGDDQPRWGGLLVAGAPDSGRLLGCQHTAHLAGPALLATRGSIVEEPAGQAARAVLLQRVQEALQQQQEELRQRRQQQGEGQQQQQQAEMEVDEAQGSAGGDANHGHAAGAGPASEHEEEEEEEEEEGQSAEQAQPNPQQREQAAAAKRQAALLAAAAALVPEPLRRPPPLPLPRQFLWQPAHTLAVTPLLGPPLLLAAPEAQHPALRERLAAGRLLLQKQQAAAGGAIQVSTSAASGAASRTLRQRNTGHMRLPFHAACRNCVPSRVL